MIALDTNILVRYLTQDDEAQFLAVMRLLNRKSARFFVSDLVWVELNWVLSDLYDWSPREIVESILRLLTIQNLSVEDEPSLRYALKRVLGGADLADALIAATAKSRQCRKLASFDRKFAKQFPDFILEPK